MVCGELCSKKRHGRGPVLSFKHHQNHPLTAAYDTWDESTNKKKKHRHCEVIHKRNK